MTRKSSTRCSLAGLERFVACVFLVVLAPVLLLVGVLIYLSVGSPVVVLDDLTTRDGSVVRTYCFRTTGEGPPAFAFIGKLLRTWSINEWPALWSVVAGEIRLREFLRLR